MVFLVVQSGNRWSVMEQKDPNTVSGLLKLHLRENGLLSQQSLDQLLPHVGSRDHVRCVSRVQSTLNDTRTTHFTSL